MNKHVKPPSITYQAVKSSQLSECGYDASTKVLGIKFTGGGTYHYFDVPPEVFQSLVKAESVGKYFGSAIRGKFTYNRQSDHTEHHAGANRGG